MDKIISDNNRLVAQTKAVIELNNMVIGKVGPVSSYVLGKFKELPVLEATFTLHLSNTYLDKELDLDQFVEEVLPDVTQPLVREKLEHTFPDITFKSVQILIISQGNTSYLVPVIIVSLTIIKLSTNSNILSIFISEIRIVLF